MGDRFTEDTRSRREIGGNSELVNFVEFKYDKDDQCQSVSQLSKLFSPGRRNAITWQIGCCCRFLLSQNLYKQQQKLFQQQRIVQGQRLKRVRQLHEDYTKNLQEMQRGHEAQQISVQEQLRKEVNMLQKKILSDTVG